VAQVTNPDRILYPLRRVGARGGGQWERVSWEEALEDIGSRIRKALLENRRDQVVYHVGRHGEDGFAERVLMAWGVDGHNSHTNVCSAAARLGYTLWMGFDRPMPDHAEAKFILLMSSHLEGGHYFNPHAQRIVEAKMKGTKIAVIDTRLSNTASQADWWLAPWPGTETGLLLAIARNTPQAHQSMTSGHWERGKFLGVEVYNKTLGIVGLGRIGRHVARGAQGLEMRVIVSDPYVTTELAQNLGVELVELPETDQKNLLSHFRRLVRIADPVARAPPDPILEVADQVFHRSPIA
jgi:hypothetical protein